VSRRCPASSIINKFSVTELVSAASRCSALNHLIRLDYFDKGQRTPTLARKLQEDRVSLHQEDTAQGLAMLARIFFKDDHNVPEHIADFCCVCTDGFGLVITLKNHETVLYAASVFATTAGFKRMAFQEVVSAFINGVTRGAHNLAKWSNKSVIS